MSVQLEERIASLPPLAVAELARPVQRGVDLRVPRLTRRRAGWLVAAGRFGVVWLPAFAFSAHLYGSVAEAFLFSSFVTFAWLLALREAFAAARAHLFAVGVWAASAVGAGTGLVVVSALNTWVDWLDFSASELIQMGGAVFVLAAAWEALAQRTIAAEQRVLIVGADPVAGDMIEQLADLGDSPFEVVGIVVDDPDLGPTAHDVSRLQEIVDAHEPDLVVVASNRPETLEALLDVASAGFKVVGPPEFYEHAFGRVPVRMLAPSWFMNVLHLYRTPYTRAAKRVFDIVVAGVGLLLTAPLFPLVAFLVSRTPGPIVFRQIRLGEGGRSFTIYKFRTMRLDAEADGAKWASERDPRITRVGGFLRKTRLDELPQLLNVLRGEMSIVGPRPERPEFAATLEAAVPFWSRRHLVKPGITGWAQVRRGYTADAEGTAEKLAYDLWYLRHRSLVLDLTICVKTFTTLVTGSGAR